MSFRDYVSPIDNSVGQQRTELSLKGLMDMTPIHQGADIVSRASRHMFLSIVKSQKTVHDVFFPIHKPQDQDSFAVAKQYFDFDRFANYYVCQAICRLQDRHNFHRMLKTELVEEEMEDIYKSADWKKVGFAIYTSLFEKLVKDPETATPFSAYMDKKRGMWARMISQEVCRPQWVTSAMQPFLKGHSTTSQYNRDINILFVKLHLLDPTQVPPVYEYLKKAFHDLTLSVVTTNYLGDPLEWTLIRHEVTQAVTRVSCAQNVSRMSLQEVDQFHGVEVVEWIMLYGKRMGLWTGQHPENRTVQRFTDRCSVM